MFRKLLFFVSLFCLGSMVFPMQVIELSIADDTCCEMTTSSDDCCTKHSEEKDACHTDSKSDNSKDSCQDHCQQCHTCHSCYMPLFLTDFNAKNSLANVFNTQKTFGYSFNFINNNFFNIWQPPKIA